MSKEFKPGFVAWLFSIFLAAGFGSLAADGMRYIIVETSKKDASLILRDKQCDDDNANKIFSCSYYFENTGDKITYITKVVILDNQYSRFFTNQPIEVYASGVNKPVKEAHVAIAEPHKMLMVGLEIKPEQAPKRTCFYNGEIELICINDSSK